MFCLPALLVAISSVFGAESSDSKADPFSVPRASALETPSDTASRLDSAARPAKASIPVAKPLYKAPDWSWEITPRLGVFAANFPERSQFSNDIQRSALAETLTVQQPYPGSDIALRTGIDLSIRRTSAFRFLLGGDWSRWSAQAIARRDSTGRMVNRSYSSDLFLGTVGLDLLISPSVMTITGARDAFLGYRFRAGAGRLEGRQAIWGISSGSTFLLGADFFTWNRLALSGALGWNTQATQSEQAWRDVLWNSPTSTSARWSSGGLSLDFVFRWGPQRDTSSLQKK